MYEVRKLDLSAVIKDDSPVTLVDGGKRISEIFVISMPVGAHFRLKVGAANPFMVIDSPFSMEPTGDQEANSGLYWANDVSQAGSVVQFIIVYGSANDKLAIVT